MGSSSTTRFFVNKWYLKLYCALFNFNTKHILTELCKLFCFITVHSFFFKKIVIRNHNLKEQCESFYKFILTTIKITPSFIYLFESKRYFLTSLCVNLDQALSFKNTYIIYTGLMCLHKLNRFFKMLVPRSELKEIKEKNSSEQPPKKWKDYMA